MPISSAERARVELTVSARDTDVIAKVPDAGRIVDGAQVMHNGVRIVAGCYHGDWMSEIIRRLRGHHEPQEELVFDAIVERLASTNPSPVMMELGAFWAYYSLWLLHRIPAGRAFLVEPDPNWLETGRRNFALNAREGVFLQAAVGRLSTPPMPFVCESDGVSRPIATESLASLLDHFGLERLDIVLADVQGAELPLLEGAREVLADGRVRFLVVSTHHHLISGDPLTHQRCLELVRSLGGHVLAEHTVAESFSGDGLIAASFDLRDRDMEIAVSRARAGSSLFGDPLHDLATAWEELEDARSDLRRSSEELAVVLAGLARAQRELAGVVATRTWRLRNRLVSALDRCRQLHTWRVRQPRSRPRGAARE